MITRALVALDIFVKLALFALLLHAVANPDLPQYADKAMQGRALAYPLAVLAIPVVWWVFRRDRPFPVVSDTLFTLPFLIDTLGNAFDLYDTIEWWDDANHFNNWILLSAAFVTLGWPRHATRVARVALGVGFGAVAAIIWELLEFVTFIPDSPEAATAYRDTLGDLGLGLLGSVVGASLAARYVNRVGWSRRLPATATEPDADDPPATHRDAPDSRQTVRSTDERRPS